MRINFQNNIYQYSYTLPQSFKSSFVEKSPNDVVCINSNHSRIIGFKEKFVNLIHQVFSKNDDILQSERIEGIPLWRFLDSTSPVIENAKIILDKKTQFSIEDYKNLTKKEREILNKAANVKYSKEFHRTVKSDFNQIDKVANGFINILNKKYPDGYSVLAVGSSPSVISEIFALNGIDVKTIPFSRYLAFNSLGYIKKNNKQYFDNAGLNTKFVSDSKKIVIVDYVASGESMHGFARLLKSKFGLDEYYLKFDIQSLNSMLDNLTNLSDKFKQMFKDAFWDCEYLGSYSYVPMIEDNVTLKKFIDRKLEFKPSVTAKLMHYLLYKKYL